MVDYKSIISKLKNCGGVTRDDWRIVLNEIDQFWQNDNFLKELREAHQRPNGFHYMRDIRFQDSFLACLTNTEDRKKRTAMDFLSVLCDIDKNQVEKFIWALKELNDFYHYYREAPSIEETFCEKEESGVNKGSHKKKVTLLSNSARRRGILKQFLIDQDSVQFESMDNQLDIEYFSEVASPCAGIMVLALQKLINVIFNRVLHGLVIAADTVILFDNTILGKAQTKSEAKARLLKYSNQLVRSISGIAAADLDTGKISLDFNLGDILFKDFSEPLSAHEKGFVDIKPSETVNLEYLIAKYVREGKSESKAGSFGIQDAEIITAARYVVGDWLSIIGLPHDEARNILNHYLGSSILVKQLSPNSFWPHQEDYNPAEKLINADKYDMLINLSMDREYRQLVAEKRDPNPMQYHKFSEKINTLNIHIKSSQILDYYNISTFQDKLEQMIPEIEKQANKYYSDTLKDVKTLNAHEYKIFQEVDQYFAIKEELMAAAINRFQMRTSNENIDLDSNKKKSKVDEHPDKDSNPEKKETKNPSYWETVIENFNVFKSQLNPSLKQQLDAQDMIAQQITKVVQFNLDDYLNKWRCAKNPRNFSPIDHRWQFINYLIENYHKVNHIYILLNNVGDESFEMICLAFYLLAFLKKVSVDTNKEEKPQDNKLVFVAMPKPHFKTMATVADVQHMLHFFLKQEKFCQYEPNVEAPISYEDFSKEIKKWGPTDSETGKYDENVIITVGGKTLKQFIPQLTPSKIKLANLTLFSILAYKDSSYDTFFKTQIPLKNIDIELEKKQIGSYYYLFSKEKKVDNGWTNREEITPYDVDSLCLGTTSENLFFLNEFYFVWQCPCRQLIAIERFFEILYQQDIDYPAYRQELLLKLHTSLNINEEICLEYFSVRSPFEDGLNHRLSRDLLSLLTEMNILEKDGMESLFLKLLEMGCKKERKEDEKEKTEKKKNLCNIFSPCNKILLSTRKKDPRCVELNKTIKKEAATTETKEEKEEVYRSEDSGDRQETNLYEIGSEETRALLSSLKRVQYKCLERLTNPEKNELPVSEIRGYKTVFSQKKLVRNGNSYTCRSKLIRFPIDDIDARRMIEELSRSPFESISTMVSLTAVEGGELKVEVEFSSAYAKLHFLNNFLDYDVMDTFMKELGSMNPVNDKIKSDLYILELEKLLSLERGHPKIRYRDVMEFYLKVHHDVITLRTGGIMIQEPLFKCMVENDIIGNENAIIGFPDSSNEAGKEKLLFEGILTNLVNRKFYTVQCFIEHLFNYYSIRSHYEQSDNPPYRNKLEAVERFLRISENHHINLNWNTLFVSSTEWMNYHLKVDLLLHHLSFLSGKPHPYLEKRCKIAPKNDCTGQDLFNRVLLANISYSSSFKEIKWEIKVLEEALAFNSENWKHKSKFLDYIANIYKYTKIAILAGNIGEELNFMVQEAIEWKGKSPNLDITFICHPVPFLLWDAIPQDFEEYLKNDSNKSFSVEALMEMKIEPPLMSELDYNQYHKILMEKLDNFDVIVVHGSFWNVLFWHNELRPCKEINTTPLTTKNVLIRKSLKNPEYPVIEIDEYGKPRQEKSYLVHFYMGEEPSSQPFTSSSSPEMIKCPESVALEYFNKNIDGVFKSKVIAKKCPIHVCYNCTHNPCEFIKDNPHAMAIGRRLLLHKEEDNQVIILKMLEFCKIRTFLVVEYALKYALTLTQDKSRNTNDSDWKEDNTINEIWTTLRQIQAIDENSNKLTIKTKNISCADEVFFQNIMMGSEIWPNQLKRILADLIANPPQYNEDTLYIINLSNITELDIHKYIMITSCFIQFGESRERIPRITSSHSVKVLEGKKEVVGNPFNHFVFEGLIKHLVFRLEKSTDKKEKSIENIHSKIPDIAQKVIAKLFPNLSNSTRYVYGNTDRIVDKIKFMNFEKPSSDTPWKEVKNLQLSYRLWDANSAINAICDSTDSEYSFEKYCIIENNPKKLQYWNLNLINLDKQTEVYLKQDLFFCDFLKWRTHLSPIVPNAVITKDWNNFRNNRAANYLSYDANREKKLDLFMLGFTVFENYLSASDVPKSLLFDLSIGKKNTAAYLCECQRTLRFIALEDYWNDVVGFSALRRQEVINIIDERKLFIIHLENLSLFNHTVKVAIFLNNAGPETMFALWLTYLLLNLGLSVTLLAPTFPMINKDVTIDDVIHLIPYFDGILVNRLGEATKRSGRLLSGFLRKSFQDCESVLELNAFNSSFDNQQVVRKDLIHEAKKHHAVIFVGELWYGYFVGLGKLLEEPISCYYDQKNSFFIPSEASEDKVQVENFKVVMKSHEVDDAYKGLLDKKVKTVEQHADDWLSKTDVFFTFTHDNPQQQLDVWDKDSGMFAHDTYETGCSVFQFIPAANYCGNDYNGWRSILKVFTIHGESDFTFDSRIFDETSFLENAIKACGFFFDLKDYKYKLEKISHPADPTIPYEYWYKTPNKRIGIFVYKFNNKYYLFIHMALNFGNLKKESDASAMQGMMSKYHIRKEEWPLLSSKIPGLIARHLQNAMNHEKGKITITDLAKKKFTAVQLPETWIKKENNAYFEIKANEEQGMEEKKNLVKIRIAPLADFKHEFKEENVYLLQICKEKLNGEASGKIYMYVPAFFNGTVKNLIAYIPNISFSQNSIQILRIIQLDDNKQDMVEAVYESGDCPKIQSNIKADEVYRALPAPIDVDTPVAERLVVRKLLEQFYPPDPLNPTGKPVLISYSEMVRIGNIFKKNVDPNWWEDYEYMTGLPRMNIQSDEKVLIQMVAPHDAPAGINFFTGEGDNKVLNKDKTLRYFIAATQLALFNTAVGVDFNFGSPAVDRQGGGARFSDNKNARTIAIYFVQMTKEFLNGYVGIENGKKECQAPFLTAKIRLCPDKENPKTPDFEESQQFITDLMKHVDWVVLHMRTKEKSYEGRCADYFENSADRNKLVNAFKEIKNNKKKLFYNGDLFNMEEVQRFWHFPDFQKIFDGIMIARGMQGNPFLIVDAIRFIQSSQKPIEYNPQRIKEALSNHLFYKEENIGYHFLPEKFKASLNKYARIITERLDIGQRKELLQGLEAVKKIDEVLYSKDLKWMVKPKFYITDRCRKCMTCINRAPCKNIKEENGLIAIDKEKCAGCGLCVKVCPYTAIEILS